MACCRKVMGEGYTNRVLHGEKGPASVDIGGVVEKHEVAQEARWGGRICGSRNGMGFSPQRWEERGLVLGAGFQVAIKGGIWLRARTNRPGSESNGIYQRGTVVSRCKDPQLIARRRPISSSRFAASKAARKPASKPTNKPTSTPGLVKPPLVIHLANSKSSALQFLGDRNRIMSSCRSQKVRLVQNWS